MGWSFLRAAIRLGRRDVARHRGRSVLVLALIALPVAAMVTAISIVRTAMPSEERQDTWREIETALGNFTGADGFSGPCELLVGVGAK